MKVYVLLGLIVGSAVVSGADVSESCPPTPATPNVTEHGCSGSIEHLWLDVYVVIDVSTSMAQHGLKDAGNFLDSIFGLFTVKPQLGHNSRVSVITYSSSATILADLNKLDNDGLDNLLPNLKCTDNTAVNLLSGFQAVESVAKLQGNFPSRRPVVLVMGTAFSEGTTGSDTIQAAENLRESGFEIITISYSEADSTDSGYSIGKIASPGFNFTSTDPDMPNQIQNALCQVNCFCLTPWYQWTDNAANGAPLRHGECLRVSDIGSNFKGANRSCDGVVASEFSPAKHDYLVGLVRSLYPEASRFFIGLNRVDGESYEWLVKDGALVPLKAGDYANWAPGFPDAKAGDCVAEVRLADDSTKWQNINCAYFSRYACQKDAYDTENYLSAEDANSVH